MIDATKEKQMDEAFKIFLSKHPGKSAEDLAKIIVESLKKNQTDPICVTKVTPRYRLSQ